MGEYTTPSGILVKEYRAAHRADEVRDAQKTLSEIMTVHDIIDVQPTHIVATERSRQLAENVAMREIGTTGQSNYGYMAREEFNPTLRGKDGWKKYDEMRRTDGAVRASLRIAKVPVIGARWYIQPASSSKQDKEIAEWVWKCYTKYQSISWFQIQWESLLCLDYGWYAFLKVFERRDGKLVWQKWAPRHPLDLYEWDWDAHGGPKGIRYYNAEGAPDSVYYKIHQMMVFTHDREGGDLEGISLLRSAYPHWYLKQNMYKIDAIQKERHGIGVPVIKLPPGYSSSDVNLANELGRNLRTNEKAHVVLPPMWDIIFAKLEGQPVDTIASIEHHNQAIFNNVMAGYLNAAAEGAGEGGESMFQKASRFIADVIRDTHNKWAIPELVRLNFGSDVEPPELKVRRLGDTVDWRTLSFAVRNLIGAKAMTPTPALEEWFRDEMDLPPLSEEEMKTAQEMFDVWVERTMAPPEAPQAGLGNADTQKKGMPRQAPATSTQQGSNAGRSTTGQDKSGG